MTSFTSQVSPQATGKLLFLSALPSMNPEFAAINLNRPITALLLTGAGTVKNKTGEYAPDLFLCAAVQLRQNADGKASTAGGVRYSRLSLPDGRTLLYEPNPLYDKMIRTKASTLFPVRRDLPMLYLEMDLASLSQLPFIRDGVSQAVASATVGNDDLQPEELTRELEKAIRQAEKISFGVNFPNEQTLEIKLGVTLKPGTETVRLFEGQKKQIRLLPDSDSENGNRNLSSPHSGQSEAEGFPDPPGPPDHASGGVSGAVHPECIRSGSHLHRPENRTDEKLSCSPERERPSAS